MASASESDGKQRKFISSGSKWEDPAAYSRAVVDVAWVFISDTVGFNPKDSSIPEDFKSRNQK